MVEHPYFWFLTVGFLTAVMYSIYLNIHVQNFVKFSQQCLTFLLTTNDLFPTTEEVPLTSLDKEVGCTWSNIYHVPFVYSVYLQLCWFQILAKIMLDLFRVCHCSTIPRMQYVGLGPGPGSSDRN